MSTIQIVIWLILAAALLFYIWAIHPDRSLREEALRFTKWDFAHRGLWNKAIGRPENSLPAFEKAAENGYAIELDVHLTADGQIIVFHDDTTRRMCGASYLIEQTTWPVLSELRLDQTDEPIPLLSEVLRVVNGRVPLLIELKLPGRNLALCPALMNLLADYQGEWIIESFNPFGLAWFRKNRPDVVRGQLSTRFPKKLRMMPLLKWFSTILVVNIISRPHFVAYALRHADSIGFRLARKLYHVPAFMWTVRTEEQYKTCRQQYDAAIFEQIRPKH